MLLIDEFLSGLTYECIRIVNSRPKKVVCMRMLFPQITNAGNRKNLGARNSGPEITTSSKQIARNFDRKRCDQPALNF